MQQEHDKALKTRAVFQYVIPEFDISQDMYSCDSTVIKSSSVLEFTDLIRR